MHRPFVFYGARWHAGAAPFFLQTLRAAVTPVNVELYRREPGFSAVLLVFPHVTFLKSGSICPSRWAEFAVRGNFCRVESHTRQLSPEPIFLVRAKSMFNQNLPLSGTGLANAHAGKTPEEQLLVPRTERPK
jgi:hypothetical protein